ncbi:MAG: LuxR C-terminal-related transcriptional regulator [Thermomicrobiales bacterium]
MQRATPDSLIERPPPRLLAPIVEPVWAGFPRTQTSFFGRTEEIAQLQALLRDPDFRLITLLGPGGVGKTRLAVAASDDLDEAFPDGAAFLNLTTATSPDHAASLIAETLGVRGQAGHTITQSLVAAIHSRRMLLVIDNLEQLINPDLRALLATLLESCPHVTILATSREPLQMQQEQRFAVAPFAAPAAGSGSVAAAASPAVQLFTARAQSVQAGFTLHEPDVETVAEICRRLDGLPLAIELAAAWVRLLSLPALLDRLSDRLPLLTGGLADQPARFQTMRAAIAWSWDRLTPDEARLMRRLAVFRGSFTLEAAAAVDGGETDDARDATETTLHLIAALADRSLLTRADAVGLAPRFTLLETVREYALEQLASAGEQAATERAHAHYYLGLTEQIAPVLFSREERVWIAQYRADHANIRAAVTWGLAHDAALAIRICYALAWFLSWYGLRDGVVWLAEGLRAPQSLPPLVRARGLYMAASLASLTGDNAATGALGEAARIAAIEAGDPIAEGLACWMVAVHHAYDGNFAAADEVLDYGNALMEQAATPTDLTVAGYMHSTSGMIALAQGNRGRCLTHYDRAVALLTRSGSPLITTIVFSDYACVLIELGNMPRARVVLGEAVRHADRSALTWEGATTLVGLALADAIEGNAERAARRLGAIEAIWRRADIAVPPYYQMRLARATELAEAELGAFAFAAVHAAGYGQYRDVLDAMIDTAAGPADGAQARETARKLGLTRREAEVFRLLIAGQADREIAASLYISVRTASKHVGAILQKLGVSSRSEAAVQGMKLGLV